LTGEDRSICFLINTIHLIFVQLQPAISTNHFALNFQHPVPIMVRTVADSLFEYLLDAFPASRTYTRMTFERKPMPPLVAQYLKQMLAQRLDVEDENHKAARSDWFFYRHPDVRQAHQALLDSLARHAQIPPSAWPEVLREAVQQVMSYLVRPTFTLTEHVFGQKKEPLSSSAIFFCINYYSAYSYLREAVEVYFEQKKIQSIDPERFEALLTRIDQQLMSDYDADAWLHLMEPLFEMVRIAPITSGGVSITLLQSFFADKGAKEILKRLEYVQKEQGVKVLDEDDLRSIIEPEKETYSPVIAPTITETDTVPGVNSSKPHTEGTKPTDQPAAEDGPVPLWKRYQKGITPAPDQETERTIEPPKPKPPVAHESSPREALPLWKKFQTSSESTVPVGPEELIALERKTLGERGPRNRDTFIKNLFAGSPEEYEHTLKRLQSASTWSQASQIIAQEVFIKHQVNIYSEPAVAFTEAVEAMYR